MFACLEPIRETHDSSSQRPNQGPAYPWLQPDVPQMLYGRVSGNGIMPLT